jgi:hypothetical protein
LPFAKLLPPSNTHFLSAIGHRPSAIGQLSTVNSTMESTKFLYKAPYRCTTAAGILLIFTSVIHLLNIGETLISIKTGDITMSYAPEATSMWLFSGMSMFLLGLWLLFLSRDIKEGKRKAWWQALIIGFSLAAFGSGCWLIYPRAFHFLFFFLYGMLLLIPLMYYNRKFQAS